MDQNFQPLLFGGDINVYSVARAFHEAYGVKSVAYGKYHTFPCAYSQIIDYRVCQDNDDPAVFLRNVEQAAQEFSGQVVLLVGCGDNYVQLAAHMRDQLPHNVVAPYVDGTLLDTLINKEHFYALCDQYGVPHPHTFLYHPEMGHDFDLPFSFPCVAKPADSVAYWQHEFPGIKKVYICQDRTELEEALDAVYAAGYPDHMILQEFIPGDDTNMRVMTCYSDRNGNVTLMCLGHVLLEEHSPYGIGNHAVIITEHDNALAQQIKSLLEQLHYIGFSNFDIKYDPRDGIYKVFEINCRQGRSNYYVTGAGHNIARCLVEDRVLEQDQSLLVTENASLWRMVPKRLAFRYIPKEYHPQMKELIRAGKDHHSLDYSADQSFQHRWRLLKNHMGNKVRFDRHNPLPGR